VKVTWVYLIAATLLTTAVVGGAYWLTNDIWWPLIIFVFFGGAGIWFGLVYVFAEERKDKREKKYFWG
jgi:hypothetical protein